MNISLSFRRRLHLLNLPGAMLLLLLQRTPVLRLFVSAEPAALAAPVGAVLKSAAASLVALGALHSRAGATELVTNEPSPLRATVGVAIPTVVFGLSGTQTSPTAWNVTGTLPPGVTMNGRTTLGAFAVPFITLAGIPTAAGTFQLGISGSDAGYVSPSLPYTITVVPGSAPATFPVFSSQPASVSVAVGATVTFSATVTGSPTPTFQWRRNGSNLGGQTSATLTLNNVQTADGGSYTLVATNSAGSATSNAATLTVTSVAVPVVPPVFSSQPISRTVNPGSTVVFSVIADGAPTFQWRQNGAIVPGAIQPSLVVSGVSGAQAGAYTCIATNSAGSVTSAVATLSIAAAGTEPSRLDGLSVLSTLAPGEGFFTVATVIGGAGTVGQKPLLVRASGPTLGSAPFGIPGTLPDPRLELFSPPTSLATNDNWGTPAANVAAISAAIASRSVFPFVAANSRDAAVFRPGLPAGNYTVQVGDAGNGAGLVLAEIYDAGTGAFTATTPRLVSVAVLKTVPTGSVVTLGFNIGGTTAKTVLIRALGPTLAAAPFSLPGTMPDPRVDVFAAGASVPFAGNDNWGGEPQILTLNNLVTFAPTAATSRDAILVITLNPGGYTVEAKPVAGSAGGSVLAEVYELP